MKAQPTLTFLLLLAFGNLLAQENIIYSNKFYESVIFPKSYQLGFFLGEEKLTNRFTPTISQAKLADSTLLFKYEETNEKFFGKKSPSRRESIASSKVNRQFVGYINHAGDSIILINLLDFSKRTKSQIKSYFHDWKKNYIIGFGTLYERNTRRYQFNMRTKEIEFM